MKLRAIILTSIFILSSIYIPFISDSVTDDVQAFQDADGGYFTLNAEWDAGTKQNVTTSTDRYNQTAGTLELDFPYAEKDTDLSAYWRMEADATGEAGTYNGTWVGVTNATGYFGDCFDFDGTSDYVSLPSVLSVGNFSTSFFMFSSDTWTEKTLVDLRGDIQANVATTGGKLRLQTYNGTAYNVLSTTSLLNDTWYMLSVTFDNTTNDGVLYVNGVKDNNGTSATTAHTQTNNIGRQYNGAEYFDGLLDEVKIYNKALNQTEITALFNSGNQYKSEGNWTSPIINGSSNKYIDTITANLSFGDANNCIDKIEIISGGNAISNATTDITTSTTLTASDFDNGLTITDNTDIYIKAYLKGNGSATPTITNLSYTIGDSTSEVANRAYVTSYYATEGTIEGFINSTKYDDNVYGWINESQTNYEMGYGQKEWAYFCQDIIWENSTATTWATAEDFNASFGGQANQSGLYFVSWSAKITGLNSVLTSTYQMRFRINETVYHNYSIVKDETYTWPIFSGFTVFNFSADWASDMFVDIITSDATDPTVMRNVRITCIPLLGQNNTDFYYNEPTNLYNISTDWVNASTLTINQTNADDDWLIISNLDLQMMNTSGHSSQIRTNVDCINSSYASMLSEPKNDLDHFDWEDYYFMNTTLDLSVGEHPICLQAKDLDDWYSNITNAQIIAIKTQSHFPQFEHNETYDLKSNNNEADHTADDNPMVSLSVTSDFATPYPFLTFANSIYNHSIATSGTVIRTDSTEYGDIYSNITGYERDGMSASADRLVYATFKKHTLNASTEYWFNTTQAPRTGDGTGTSYHLEGEINTLAMAVPMYELNTTFNITGINKTKGENYTFKIGYILTTDETTPTISIYNYTSTAWEDTSFNPTKDGIEHNFSYNMNEHNVNSTGVAQIRYTIAEHEGGQTDLALDFVWVDYDLDVVLPQITDVTDTPDPQEYNGYVNITSNVTDDNGISTVYVNISLPNSTYQNNSMTLATGNLYYYNTSYTLVGLHNYSIWALDNKSNYNSSAGNFTIEDTTLPLINWVNLLNTTTTLNASISADLNTLDSRDTNYWLALNGTGYDVIEDAGVQIGQFHSSEYSIKRGYLTFDTSAIPDSAIINSATLYLTTASAEYSTTNFNISIYSKNYGAFSHSDWNTSAIFDSTFMSTVGISVNTQYSNSVNSSNINKTGSTQYELRSDREGEIPTVTEWIYFNDSISSNSPYLLINYTPIYTFEYTDYVNISANTTDYSALTTYINITAPDTSTTNTSMNNSGDIFYLNQTYEQVGNYSYIIWTNDIYGNTNTSTGNFTIVDTTLPLINSVNDTPDPQEYNQYVNVSANITDHSAITSYLNISYPNSTTTNTTMNNTGDIFYSNQTYSQIGLHNYTIWTNDTYGNTNSTTGNFTIEDTTPSLIYNTTTSPSTQEYNGYVNITSNVTDDNGISTVYVNISLPNSTYQNNSMTLATGNLYYYNSSYTLIGTYNVTVWAMDSEGNINNSGIFYFIIVDTTPSLISNVNATPDPQTYNGYVNVSANITDHSEITTTYLNISNPNGTFTNTSMSNSTSYYWINQTYTVIGLYNFTIYTNDTYGNTNTSTGNFTIIDNVTSEINNTTATPSTQEYNGYVNITTNITDHSNFTAYINITAPDTTTTNTTMNNTGTDTYYTNNTYTQIGLYNFTIWVTDSEGNVNSTTGNFTIEDTTAPVIAGETATPPTAVQGSTINVSATITDYSAVSSSFLNISNPNGTFTNTSMDNSGSNYWNSTTYTVVGVYTFYIWANDTYGNMAMATGTFTITATITDEYNSSTHLIIVYFDIKIEKEYFIFTYREDADIDAVQVRWSFGDGEGAIGNEVIHEYEDKNKEYTITMEVITKEGKHLKTSRTIQVGTIIKEKKTDFSILGYKITSAGLISGGILAIILIGFRIAYPPIDKKILGRIIAIRTSMTIAIISIIAGIYLGGYLDGLGAVIQGLFG